MVGLDDVPRYTPSGSGSLQCSHLVDSVESRCQLFIFSEIVKSFYKCYDICLCMLTIDLCKISSERHFAGFRGRILFTGACKCIFIHIIVWGCRRNWVTCGGIFVWCVVIYRKMRVICKNLVIHIHTNKIFEENAVLLHLIDTGVCGTFLNIGYLCSLFLLMLYHSSSCGCHWCVRVHETNQAERVYIFSTL